MRYNNQNSTLTDTDPVLPLPPTHLIFCEQNHSPPKPMTAHGVRQPKKSRCERYKMYLRPIFQALYPSVWAVLSCSQHWEFTAAPAPQGERFNCLCLQSKRCLWAIFSQLFVQINCFLKCPDPSGIYWHRVWAQLCAKALLLPRASNLLLPHSKYWKHWVKNLKM